MATFDVDDLYVDTGTYAWVYQNQTGPVDLAAERVYEDGQLFPTYPQFNPQLVRLKTLSYTMRAIAVPSNQPSATRYRHGRTSSCTKPSNVGHTFERRGRR